jgi:hypothetical protein
VEFGILSIPLIVNEVETAIFQSHCNEIKWKYIHIAKTLLSNHSKLNNMLTMSRLKMFAPIQPNLQLTERPQNSPKRMEEPEQNVELAQ